VDTDFLGTDGLDAPEIITALETAGPLAPSASGVAGRGIATTVLLVDSAEINRQVLKRNLYKGLILKETDRVLEARRPTEALAILEKESVDLIIADLLMPEFGGEEFCRRVKSNRLTRLIPILIMTSAEGVRNEVACLSAGADDYIVRPPQTEVLRTRVSAMLRMKRTVDDLEEAESILFALAQAVEQRDKEIGNHCQRLATYSVALGTALGLDKEDLLALRRGGFLHDIGKVRVPDAILFKRGPLTDQEWVEMRAHTLIGERICSPMKSLAPVLPIIRSHHERWDGSGYPDAMAGDAIPLLARVLQLADIYDALTSERSYKPAYTSLRAMDILRQEAQQGWRDPELVSIFCEVLRDPAMSSFPLDSGPDGLDTMGPSLENLRRRLSN
jgi:putative two-component system response regulator